VDSRRFVTPISFVLALLLIPGFALGEPATKMLGFQGHLRDRSGNPVVGSVPLAFRLYDAPFGGSLVAGPFGPVTVSPREGRYSVRYGPVPPELLERGSLWLEVSVGESRLPRLALEKVFYDWVNDRGALAGDRTLVALPSAEAALPAPSDGVAAPSTTILTNGPSSNRIDLVYVGDGYLDSELGTYAADVARGLQSLLSQEPFASYRTFFNAHRVDVVSKESGVDNDPYGTLRNTALDMGFYCGGIDRLLCVSVDKAMSFAAAAPDVDHVFAVANSSTYGGAGYTTSDLATFAGGNDYAPEIAVHETGHSLGNLADEYDYGGATRYSGPEPPEPNVSTLDARSMASAGSKWARWLGNQGIGFGGLVDTYEGADYSQRGIYRPTADSKMRTLGSPFNLPSVESLILQMYRIVRPIDDATPAGTTLDERSTVFVTPVALPGRALPIQWALDGRAIAGQTGTTLSLCGGSFPLGDHVLTVTVRDDTPWVQDEAQRAQWLTESRSWNVHIGGSGCGTANAPPNVAAPSQVTGAERSTISFTVSASDPEGGSVSVAAAPLGAGASFLAAGNGVWSFSWTPGDGTAGSYGVTFTATDLAGASAQTSTTIVVTPAGGASADSVVLTPASTVLRLDSGQPTWCASIVPSSGAFAASDVDLATIGMTYAGGRASAVGTIAPGAVSVEACWAKSDLGALFAGLPPGLHAVTAVIQGGLKAGGGFSGRSVSRSCRAAP